MKTNTLILVGGGLVALYLVLRARQQQASSLQNLVNGAVALVKPPAQ